MPEIKKRKQKNNLRVGDQSMFKKKIKKKYWRSYAHRYNKACDLYKMCVDPEPKCSEAPSNLYKNGIGNKIL